MSKCLALGKSTPFQFPHEHLHPVQYFNDFFARVAQFNVGGDGCEDSQDSKDSNESPQNRTVTSFRLLKPAHRTRVHDSNQRQYGSEGLKTGLLAF